MNLIIGQGLAGTLLALELRSAGVPYLVAEGNLRNSGSAVAAGIINPVTGKRLAKTWRWERFKQSALDTYRSWEKLLGVELFRETRLLRLFRDEEEKTLWRRKKGMLEYSGLLGPSYSSEELGPGLKDDFGSFEIMQAGVLEVQTLIKTARFLLQKEGSLAQRKFIYEDLVIKDNDFSWQGQRFQNVIFCEGFRLNENPWFRNIPMEPSRGEIQKICVSKNLPEGIINRGKWMRPTSEGVYYAGSTHRWDQLEMKSDEGDKKEISRELGSIIKRSFEIIDRKTGVRPATKDRRPVVGFHPNHSQLGIINGLGAKGSLMGPWLAKHFTSALLKGTPIEPEVNVQRYFNKP